MAAAAAAEGWAVEGWAAAVEVAGEEKGWAVEATAGWGWAAEATAWVAEKAATGTGSGWGAMAGVLRGGCPGRLRTHLGRDGAVSSRAADQHASFSRVQSILCVLINSPLAHTAPL